MSTIDYVLLNKIVFTKVEQKLTKKRALHMSVWNGLCSISLIQFNLIFIMQVNSQEQYRSLGMQKKETKG